MVSYVMLFSEHNYTTYEVIDVALLLANPRGYLRLVLAGVNRVFFQQLENPFVNLKIAGKNECMVEQTGCETLLRFRLPIWYVQKIDLHFSFILGVQH
jgi:hypothetical protein